MMLMQMTQWCMLTLPCCSIMLSLHRGVHLHATIQTAVLVDKTHHAVQSVSCVWQARLPGNAVFCVVGRQLNHHLRSPAYMQLG